jgi:hypothetical protein
MHPILGEGEIIINIVRIYKKYLFRWYKLGKEYV